MSIDFLPDPLPNVQLTIAGTAQLFDLGLTAYRYEIADPFLLGFYDDERSIENNMPIFFVAGLVYRRIVIGPMRLIHATDDGGEAASITPSLLVPSLPGPLPDPLPGLLSRSPSEEQMRRLYCIFPHAASILLMFCKSLEVEGLANFQGFLWIGYRDMNDVCRYFHQRLHPEVIGGFIIRNCIRSFVLAAGNNPHRFRIPPPVGAPAQDHATMRRISRFCARDSTLSLCRR
jgi:hypothetical protein